MTEVTKNIVIFGEGAGKSSVINLIAGKPLAKVSSDLTRCTLAWKEYSLPEAFGGSRYNLFDTMGIENSELELDFKSYLAALADARNLIKTLDDRGGIHLLLYCIGKGRATATLQVNYRLFYEILYERKVPIVLIITHLEAERVMEDWWERNRATLDEYDIRVARHACITTVGDDRSKYDNSQRTIRRLLQDSASNEPVKRGTFVGGRSRGLAASFGRLLRTRPDPNVRALQYKLRDRCGMKKNVAQKVANRII